MPVDVGIPPALGDGVAAVAERLGFESHWRLRLIRSVRAPQGQAAHITLLRSQWVPATCMYNREFLSARNVRRIHGTLPDDRLYEKKENAYLPSYAPTAAGFTAG